MMKYKYTGSYSVTVPGIGFVEPDQEIETDQPVNHPLFVPAADKKLPSKIKES